MADPEKEASEEPSAFEVPVDWEALEDAFENNAAELHSFLHLPTGDVLRLVDGVADPKTKSRIAGDREYLRVDPVSSREQYRWMERFIGMLDAGELRDQLAASIDGRGAFRRFKDVLMAHVAEREQWFSFRGERLTVFMEAWLKAHAIQPVPRKNKLKSGGERAAADSSQPGAKPRRARGADACRRQLRELALSLSVKELEKVVAFAEFVKAQRVVRSGLQVERPSDRVARLPTAPIDANALPSDDSPEADAAVGAPQRSG